MNQEQMISTEKCGRCKADVERRRGRKKGKTSATKHGEIGDALGDDTRGVKRRDRNENVLACPMDFAKTLKLRFRVGDLDLPERRNRYASGREEEEIDALICPRG